MATISAAAKTTKTAFYKWLKKNKKSYRNAGDDLGIGESSVWRIAHGEHWASRDLGVKIIEYTGGEVTADDVWNVPVRLRRAA